MSITYLKDYKRFFKTRSITHVTGINIYIYTQTCVQDGMKMRQNLFVDLLAYERNRYRRFFSADINIILVASRKSLYIRVCELATPRSVTVLISQTLPFRLNITLMSIFNFIVLLSYRAIHVFLV